MALSKRNREHLCPHCKEVAIVYTSRQLSELVTEKYLKCSNIECGHGFVVSIGVVRTIEASLMPKADLHIPLVERRANDIVVERIATVPNQLGMAHRRLPVPVQRHAGTMPTRARH
ncbi:ogr/Delta-like zinc finger family protein [Luteibacter sp. NPDC031894]|uniref:ogr/Delta-like zinc finger family protein n=1 Tax=Luteibacter sp. NPDC031894 TaxID=3390572 RepID=UPI003D001F52